MENKYIKNIDFENILLLKDQVDYLKGQIVSKTLVQNDFVSLTLFAFGEGEEISTHESSGDAMVTCLDGKGQITIDNKKYILNKGETIIMPSHKPHAVLAVQNFKMVLLVIFPGNENIK
ncbi:MAG: cupin domain-containing protein [Oscillospiraceae bacterium]|nr:cupin domain-containing protein [Oscillospiraceae bacterium]